VVAIAVLVHFRRRDFMSNDTIKLGLLASAPDIRPIDVIAVKE
jgi:hypothetical protein